MARARQPTVLQVTGPVVIDFGNGVRIQLSPVGMAVPVSSATAHPMKDVVAPRGRPGRKPSPATVKLIEAMRADAAAGQPRTRTDYLAVLRGAGGPASDNAAGIIVNREAKRVFGAPLGRLAGIRRGKAGPRGRGSPATAMLREKLAADKEKGDLRNAPYYTRWLVDQEGLQMG